MGRPYSDDLRERVVRAVVKGGLSRHQAAARFGVGISTAINWVQRFLETGSVKPDQIGGYRPKKIAGPHREWLIQRCRKDFTVRGLVAELAERGLKVDYARTKARALREAADKRAAEIAATVPALAAPDAPAALPAPVVNMLNANFHKIRVGL
jgi:putative transposase